MYEMMDRKGVLKMIKKINFLKDESGAVLVIALIMMVIFTMIGIAGSFTSIFEIIISGHKRGSTNAFYSADSGVQVVVANINNFDLPGRYTNKKYDPFSDDTNPNPNPTGAKIIINYDDTQVGAPRGSGFSATGNFEFVHYVIESTGTDRIEMGSTPSTCMIEQKVVRLIPTLQGGN
jgi:hypothetical protein